MPEPIIFSGLTRDQADATAQFHQDQGASVEVVPDANDQYIVRVTYPAEVASGTPSGAPSEFNSADQPTSGSSAGGVVGAHIVASAANIIAECEKAFPANKADCSAFVRAVSDAFGVQLTGLANQIVDQIRGAGWRRLADGRAAETAADSGEFVIGGLKGTEQSVPSEHGHVVVVVSGPLDPVHHAYPMAYWGRLGGGGKKNTPVTFAWRAADRDHVTYAAVVK
jgi:hypothetical protein